MTYAPKTGSFWKTLALVVVAVGVAAPVAAARTGDALDRYLTTHMLSTTAPVSDVANSLQVGRLAAARPNDALGRYLSSHRAPSIPAPLSDLGSSLQVARIAAARPNDALGRYLSTYRAPSSRAPISDNANSQMLVRSASSTPIVSAPPSAGFAWTEAAIGAGTTLLVILAAAAALTLVRRHRALAV